MNGEGGRGRDRGNGRGRGRFNPDLKRAAASGQQHAGQGEHHPQAQWESHTNSVCEPEGLDDLIENRWTINSDLGRHATGVVVGMKSINQAVALKVYEGVAMMSDQHFDDARNLNHDRVNLPAGFDEHGCSRVLVDGLPGKGQCFALDVSPLSNPVEREADDGRIGPLALDCCARKLADGEIAPCWHKFIPLSARAVLDEVLQFVKSGRGRAVLGNFFGATNQIDPKESRRL